MFLGYFYIFPTFFTSKIYTFPIISAKSSSHLLHTWLAHRRNKVFIYLQREAIHNTSSHRPRMARFHHRDGSHLSLLPIPSSHLDNHHLAHICRYLYVKELHSPGTSLFNHRPLTARAARITAPIPCTSSSGAGRE